MAANPEYAIETLPGPALEVRALGPTAELEACVRLQREVWGEGFREVVPPNLLRVAQKVGGLVAGAFADGSLVGFVFGLTGTEEGRLIHWSHMLAVRAEARDRGIGQRLKTFQRDWLRERNVERVYWTFDPLVARNAHLNLERLGAEVADYVPDMYGPDMGSPLHAGLGTDRLVVAWHLDAGPRGDAGADWSDVPAVDGGPFAGEAEGVRRVRIEIPEDIQATRRHDAEAAVRWRRHTRAAFQHFLGRGWRVAGFVRDPEAGRCSYLLEAQG